jgi:hypothetical protein
VGTGDTTADARQAQCAALRALGPARRLELALEMSEQARAIALQGLRARRPDLGRREARALLLRRLLGDALFEAAWRGRTPR